MSWLTGLSADQLAALRPSHLPIPPPARRAVDRVQLNCKMEIELTRQLRAFVELHQTSLQAVVEAAVEEYMAVRGYTRDEHRRRRP